MAYNGEMNSAKVGNFTVWFENAEEFAELRREIWVHHAYYIDDLESPKVIIDMGAQIGLATLYFAQMYPDSKIVAYEPDPANFALLTKNIAENNLINVELINEAVAPKSGKMNLQTPIYPDEWRSGVGVIPGGWRGVLHTRDMVVEARGIDEVLSNSVDLVKMDIEGMEYEVLDRASLKKVKHMIVEVHPRSGKRIHEIEKKLIASGFVLTQRKDESKWGVGLSTIVADRV